MISLLMSSSHGLAIKFETNRITRPFLLRLCTNLGIYVFNAPIRGCSHSRPRLATPSLREHMTKPEDVDDVDANE